MGNLVILLPLAVYVLLLALFWKRTGLAEALIRSHLLVLAFIAVSTEALSAGDDLAHGPLLLVWLAAGVCAGAALAVWGGRAPDYRSLLAKREIFPAVLTGIVALILLLTLITGIVYPPNNWDSMTYHMARVAHWISDRSVAFYPTSIERQNYQMPLAEFGILHLQVLVGSDVFAALVQWTAFVVSICLAARLAAELGFSKRTQRVAAVVAATLPMVILQSSSTQNDVVASAFVLAFVLFLLRFRREFSPGQAAWAGLSLGLALLTKGTGYIYCAAVGPWLGLWILRKAWAEGRGVLAKAVAGLGLVMLLALILNTGSYVRNYRLYGNIFSNESGYYWNQDYSVVAMSCNVAKNVSIHLGTPIRSINDGIYRGLFFVFGKELDNPSNNVRGVVFGINSYLRHEDFAGNPVHLLVFLGGLAFMMLRWGQEKSGVRGYAAAVLLGGLAYCICLRWQPWASRLHTTFFLLAAPITAYFINAGLKTGRERAGAVLLLLMVLYALPFAYDNRTRSLSAGGWRKKGREEFYFAVNEGIYKNYRDVLVFLKERKVREAGLYLGGDDWEYPFWALSAPGGNIAAEGSVRFRHVGVEEKSALLEKDGPLPLYVIASRDMENWKYRSDYRDVYASGSLHVFQRRL